VDLGYVRMVQRGEDLRFTPEARHALRIVREAGGQDLQRDVASELRVPGAIHLAYAPLAEGCDDVVETETCAYGEGHDGTRLAQDSRRACAL
jgi:hypothetical protein